MRDEMQWCNGEKVMQRPWRAPNAPPVVESNADSRAVAAKTGTGSA